MQLKLSFIKSSLYQVSFDKAKIYYSIFDNKYLKRCLFKDSPAPTLPYGRTSLRVYLFCFIFVTNYVLSSSKTS